MFSRAFFAAWLLASSALAVPPLTIVQDVLYKADGTRFNGLVTVSWSSFEAPDQSAVATQMITTKVVNGNLRVQLVPNSQSDPQVLYAVTYNSDGLVQFSESWQVPPSSTPLRLRDVRVPSSSSGNDTNNSGPIQESNVVGLGADLSARPVKGAGFAPGAVAVVNNEGAIDSVAGNPADCVHVDGSSGPCGSPQPTFMDADVPSGIVDGSNLNFTLSGTPSPAASLAVYRNGLLQEQGVDYTLVNHNVIQFAGLDTPQPGDTLLAAYRLPSVNGTAQMYASPQVLCSGSGGSVNTTTTGSLAACTVPQGVLNPGDRVEIRFDLAHQGSAGGFTFQLQWGATTVLQRTAAASDVQVSGRADAGLDPAGAQVATQSWGTVLPFSATVGNAPDAFISGLVIGFQGAMLAGGETLTLRNYAVVRVP